MASRQSAFVNRAYQQARAAGLPDAQARLAAAQSALETNYGKSAVGNNYFGIKAGTSWTGPSVTAGTWEDTAAGPVKERAAFRAYTNPAESFKDWASTVGRRWSDALSAPTLAEAVEGLNYGKPGGYATDRRYGQKILGIDRMFGPETTFDIPNSVPTPTPAPDIAGILGGVQTESYAAPLGQVQRSPLNEVEMASPFDMARFGTPEFDMARFGTEDQTAIGMNALRRGLLDQQLDYGVLPSLENPAYAAMQATPTVATAYQAPPATVEAPASIQAATGFAQPQQGLLSPAEQQAVAAQQSYLSGQPLNKAPSEFGSKAKQLGAGVLGAILGGFALGPVGAVAGGLLGNTVSKPGGLLGGSFPAAPKSQSRGDGGLTSYGRSVAEKSDQFGGAVKSGASGLW